MTTKAKRIRRPATRQELENRLTRTLMALPWQVIGPIFDPKETEARQAWSMSCPALGLHVWCASAAECRKEWPDALECHLRSYAMFGELPPCLQPSGWRVVYPTASGSLNTGGTVTIFPISEAA